MPQLCVHVLSLHPQQLALSLLGTSSGDHALHRGSVTKSSLQVKHALGAEFSANRENLVNSSTDLPPSLIPRIHRRKPVDLRSLH